MQGSKLEDGTAEEVAPLKGGKEVHMKTWKDRVRAVIDGSMFTSVMTFVTVYALFGDDLRLALFPADADILFVAFSSVAFFMFLLELVLQSLVKKGYLALPACQRKYMNKKDWWRLVALGSFYFWLDVIATASLVPEVPLPGISALVSAHLCAISRRVP